MEDRFGWKAFFNNLGVASAIMAGFSFTAIVELRDWAPPEAALREILYAFLFVSFLSFLMPLLLNAYFLNLTANDEKMAGIFRQARLIYTLITGVGLGGLLGACCLFVLCAFPSPLPFIVVTFAILSLMATLVIIRWFKYRLRPFQSAGAMVEKSGDAD